MAVLVGVIVSALVFAWKQATRMSARVEEMEGSKTYKVEGPLFFGSTTSFADLFDPKGDPNRVTIDFAAARVADHSGLAAIDALAAKYHAEGKDLRLRHLSPDCQRLLSGAGQLIEPAEDDPNYGVAVDYGIRIGRTDTGH